LFFGVHAHLPTGRRLPRLVAVVVPAVEVVGLRVEVAAVVDVRAGFRTDEAAGTLGCLAGRAAVVADAEDVDGRGFGAGNEQE
jgi:hypothetical protein